jgi:hypothetical protein
MALPGGHGFKPGGDDTAKSGYQSIVKSGTYWWLEPLDKTSERGNPKNTFLPVGDSVSAEWSHEWTQTQNLTKSNAPTSALALPSYALQRVANALVSGGGGMVLSTTAMYNDTRAPSVTINSKVFSPNGDGELMAMLEMLRNCSHGIQKENPIADDSQVNGALANAGLYAQFINHPTLWSVKLITIGGMAPNTSEPKFRSPQIVGHWQDMYIARLNIELFSPWIGKDPCYANVNLDLVHAMPGVNTSSHLGQGEARGSAISSNLGGGENSEASQAVARGRGQLQGLAAGLRGSGTESSGGGN